jgi:predicted nuclease with TOPRIM domain
VPDDPDNLILSLLRAIRGDIGHIKGDIVEVKERLGFLESSYASLSRRVDRLGGDVERIKVRLDIVDVPAT